jgi:hypothetical protein
LGRIFFYTSKLYQISNLFLIFSLEREGEGPFGCIYLIVFK